MAAPAPALDMETLVPAQPTSNLEERDLIKPIIEKPWKEGDIWCVVNSQWLRNWKNYVQYTYFPPLVDKGKPGPIENMPLVDTDAKETGDIVVIKQGLFDGIDFELIPLEAWHILYAWWASNLICIGLHFRYNGGPAIKRKVVKASGLMNWNNSLSVEVRLLALNCVKSSDQLPVSIGYFSRNTTVEVFKV